MTRRRSWRWFAHTISKGPCGITEQNWPHFKPHPLINPTTARAQQLITLIHENHLLLKRRTSSKLQTHWFPGWPGQICKVSNSFKAASHQTGVPPSYTPLVGSFNKKPQIAFLFILISRGSWTWKSLVTAAWPRGVSRRMSHADVFKNRSREKRPRFDPWNLWSPSYRGQSGRWSIEQSSS